MHKHCEIIKKKKSFTNVLRGRLRQVRVIYCKMQRTVHAHLWPAVPHMDMFTICPYIYMSICIYLLLNKLCLHKLVCCRFRYTVKPANLQIYPIIQIVELKQGTVAKYYTWIKRQILPLPKFGLECAETVYISVFSPLFAVVKQEYACIHTYASMYINMLVTLTFRVS